MTVVIYMDTGIVDASYKVSTRIHLGTMHVMLFIT